MANPRRRRRRSARRRNPNPPRRRRRQARSRFFGFRANPRRRRRRARRNPGFALARRRRGGGFLAGAPPVQEAAMQVLWAGAGFMGTKFVGNMVMPMIGVTQPLARIAVKGGLAYGTAWGMSMVLGDRRVFMPLFLGGMAEVIQDVVRTYVSPFVPALAAAEYPLEAYPEMGQEMLTEGAMGAYPDILGEEVDVAQ